MDIKNPVVVYEAATSEEAHFMVELLAKAGIAAHTEEDAPIADGPADSVPQAHRARVYVDETNAENAGKTALQFLQAQRDRAVAEDVAGDIEVECDSCGKSSTFAQSLTGTTQDCPHCFAFIDVGDEDWMSEEEWGDAQE